VIRHLLKLVWHRKGANALIITEIFFSFLIVFVVATLGVALLSRWGAPTGFDWHDVWVMSVTPIIRGDHSWTRMSIVQQTDKERTAEQQTAAQVDRVMRELRSFPQIESVAADGMTPYANHIWTTGLQPRGRDVTVTADQATDDFARVMKIRLLQGRWFTPDDEARNYQPIVIDTDAARTMFGTKDALGQKFVDDHFGDDNVRTEMRVVGVIAPFRQQGELSENNINMVFFRASLHRPAEPLAKSIVFRVRPGTPASFEAELNQRLHPESADMTFHIQRMDQMRTASIRLRIVPLIALGIVALFLISMVTLGLTGVLWQTVTRRMREIGLRRAVGASGRAVRSQVLMEVALLATLAVSIGVVIVLQLPLLGLSRVVSPGEFAMGFVAALVVIYAITLACGAYPGGLASRIEPAEALRYE